MNFSGTVGRINLILFALESVFEDASFDYNKPIIRYNLIFDLGFFGNRVHTRNKSENILKNVFGIINPSMRD